MMTLMTRKRRRRPSGNGKKQSGRPRRGGKRNTGRWRRRERKCGKR